MRNYLFYVMIILPMLGFGQIMSEGFESETFPPADWVSFENESPIGTPSLRSWGRTMGTSTLPAPEGTAYAIVVWERTFDSDPATNFEDWLVTKQIDLSNSENTQMTFQTRSVFNRPNNFNILVSTTSQTDPAAFTLVKSWDNNTIGATPETWNVYNTKTVDLSDYDGQVIYIAFQYINDNGGNWVIDDVIVNASGSDCGSVINYAATNITTNSSELTWDDVSGAVSYDIEWGVTGFEQGTGTLVEGVTSPYLLENLNGETTYDVYFRSVCNESLESAWTEALTFTTLENPPINDDCDNAISLACGNNLEGSTANATDSAGNLAGDVFYKFTGNGTEQEVTVSLCGSQYDTMVRIFSDCTLTQEIASNDDSDQCGSQSVISFLSDGTSTYIIMVEGNGDNTGDYSIALTCEDIVNPSEYCEPVTECSDGDLITNVTFAGINNNTECSPNGFSDYTDQMAEVEAGSTNQISVSVGSGWTYESVMVWIDFNNNFDFEPSEYFFVGSDPGTTLTSDIVIPVGTPAGAYRMRVRVGAVNPDSNDLSTLACDEETVIFGETEDYTVNVGKLGVNDVKTSDFIYYPNPVNDELNIISTKAISKLSVYNPVGQLVLSDESVKNNKLNLNALSSGVYILHATFEDGQVEIFKIIKK